MKLEEKRSSAFSWIEASFLVGGGLLTYGAWLAYAPAGFIVPGLLLLGGSVVGIMGARR